jgi:peptidoglycan-N-acetylglucosamine deacetylase
MRRITPLLSALALTVVSLPAFAGSCPNPDALGTSRTLVIGTSHLHLGSMQYHETLPLGPHEVVLTFDDGPLPPNTDRILNILKSQCVEATYFLVGEMAQSYPSLVRRIYADGHTIGTHSYDHPLTFNTMSAAAVAKEVNGGIAAVSKALGNPAEVAPFFRIPGLLHSATVDNYLASHSLVTWSVDVDADDWFRHITPEQIAQRAIQRLDARGRGILLLHDIHLHTALALPIILRELKKRGYHVVHVVPAEADRPATVTEAQQWLVPGKRHVARPVAAKATPSKKSHRATSRESVGSSTAGHELSLAPHKPAG